MELSTGKDWQELVETCDTFLFDCDGVLWKGNTVIPGGVEMIKFLQARKKQIFFVTNNSTKSRSEYVKKFLKLGYPVEFDQIMCTAFATGYYMKNVLNFKGKAYLLGRPGFKQELNDIGIETSDIGPDVTSGDLDSWSSIPLDPSITGVIVGFDEHFNFKKMTLAGSYLADPNCQFIATNEDNMLPTPGGVVVPGTGSFVAAVKCIAGREPTVIGKPHFPIFDCLKSLVDITPSRTVMVGDRLNTDIVFGNRNGMKTVLTLTGVTSKQSLDEELKGTDSELKPLYYTSSLQTLLQ